MLFARAFDNRSLLDALRRLRKKPIEAYGFAVIAVAIATALRFSLIGSVSEAVPFTIYFVAIILTALFAGFWPGMVALFLSTVLGWYLFVPPAFSFALTQPEAVALAVFITVGGSLVVLVSGLIGSVLLHQDQQQLLVRELQHRSQNLFSVIQAIVSRSLVEGQPVSATKEILNGRLTALAHTHSMLAKGAWIGAPLNAIILQELSGFRDQVSITGCNLTVNTPAAQNFALIIHELATNAAKYGALSSPHGRVGVECNIENTNGSGMFRFVWRESNGPPVIGPPTRRGFGSTILFDVAKGFGQNVEADYRPDGLIYRLQLLLNEIEAPQEKPAPAANEVRMG